MESWLSVKNRIFFSIIHLCVEQRRGQVAHVAVGKEGEKDGMQLVRTRKQPLHY